MPCSACGKDIISNKDRIVSCYLVNEETGEMFWFIKTSKSLTRSVGYSKNKDKMFCNRECYEKFRNDTMPQL